MFRVLILLEFVVVASSRNFILIIDGGSSGSRIHCLPYDNASRRNGLPEFDHKTLNYKVKPGLSSYAEDPGKAGESISSLLDWAKKESVPPAEWSSTPVYLKATAGLRSIDQVKASKVLESCREVMAKSPFVFEQSWARIISGVDEGKYAWIAANYLLKFIHSIDIHDKVSNFPVGIMEMGGGSLQVSFLANSSKKYDEIESFQLGDQIYDLVAYSFLGYGLEDVQMKFIKSNTLQTHPCYPSGYAFKDIPGKGDFNLCLEKMKSVVPTEIAGIQNVSFIAIENFYYTSLFFGIDELKPELVLPTLRDKASEFCSSKWSDLQQRYNQTNGAGEELHKYCFSAAYIITLLGSSNGLGFADPLTNVKILRDIDGVSIDWALGSAIYEVMKPKLGLLNLPLSISSIPAISALFLFVSLTALLYLKRRRRNCCSFRFSFPEFVRLRSEKNCIQ